MKGDFDSAQRRDDAAGRVPSARWCPASSDVLAVLSGESVRHREAERRLEQARAQPGSAPPEPSPAELTALRHYLPV